MFSQCFRAAQSQLKDVRIFGTFADSFFALVFPPKENANLLIKYNGRTKDGSRETRKSGERERERQRSNK